MTTDNDSPLVVGLVSISDRASKGVYVDQGVPALRDWFEAALSSPWRFETRLIPDERAGIERTLVELVDAIGCHLVLTTGGTGPAPRDVTPEAIEPLFEKRIDGFGEEFRRRSWSAPASSPWRSSPDQEGAIGARAMLSRATAGVVDGTIVVALPGSPAAVELGAMLLVDMLPHAVDVASGRHGHHHKKH